MGIKLTSDPFSGALDKLSKAGPRLQNATMKNASILHRNMVTGIRRQKYMTNSIQNWAPLSDKYLASQKKRNSVSRVNEGDLSSSIDIHQHDKDAYEVGTNHVAALAHEFGYEPKNLPERPYMRPAMDESSGEMRKNWENALGGENA
jgi:phage gpG-like protein